MSEGQTAIANENTVPTTITMTPPTPVVAKTDRKPSEEHEETTGATAQLEIVFSKTLSLEIPVADPSSSMTSSPASSPVGHLDRDSLSAPGSSTNTTSCSSLELGLATNSASTTPTLPPLNVKFAPLPELAPRKRRSSVPLGMAARSQLVRRRRGNNYYQQYMLQDVDSPSYQSGDSPMWTDEEMAEEKARQAAAAQAEKEKEREKERKRKEEKRQARLKPSPYEKGHGNQQDPIVLFGKKVQQIWKKVSQKDMKKEALAGQPQTDGEEGQRKGSTTSTSSEGTTPSGYSTPNSSKPPTPIDPNAPLRSILVASAHLPPLPPLPPHQYPQIHEEPLEEEEEGGGVWEEEIDPHFPLTASQAGAKAAFNTGLLLPSSSPSETSSPSSSLSDSSSQHTRRLSTAWSSSLLPPQLELTGLTVTDMAVAQEPVAIDDGCATPTNVGDGPVAASRMEIAVS